MDPVAPAKRSPWRALLIEYALLQVVLLAYTIGRFLVRAGSDVPYWNALAIMAWERALHIDVELAWQQFFLGVPGAIAFLNAYYAYMHFTPMIVFLVWVYVYRPRNYAVVRNLFLITTLAGFLVQWTVPTAPPRLTHSSGLVDTLAMGKTGVDYEGGVVGEWTNQFAALPSFHFAWAAFSSLGVIALTTARWRYVALLHPLLITVSIVATGNHFFLDAVAVVPVMGLPVGAYLWYRRRLRVSAPSRFSLPGPDAIASPEAAHDDSPASRE